MYIFISCGEEHGDVGGYEGRYGGRKEDVRARQDEHAIQQRMHARSRNLPLQTGAASKDWYQVQVSVRFGFKKRSH